MRTNIDIDDDLMAEALQLSELKTKKDVVDSALEMYVKILRQKRLLELAGKVKWEGNLGESKPS